MALESTAQRAPSGWIGKVLPGGWRIEAQIASGGVATVYRARSEHGERAAVKVLHPELSRNPEVNKRFLQEGFAANTVDHPGVVRVLATDTTEEGAPFVLMELLEGELLEDRRVAAGGRLPLAEVCRVTSQLLGVLAAAHAKGVVHRDIKPDNLFVLRDGTLKVLDFGIAHIKQTALSHEATATGLVLGTPDFMAPEQALGQRGQVDAQTDLWAVGATMFQLLSGQSVHPAESLAMLLTAASSRPARSLAAAAKDVPPAIVAVVDRALSFEKARRWPSARAMKEALEAAVARLPRASFPVMDPKEHNPEIADVEDAEILDDDDDAGERTVSMPFGGPGEPTPDPPAGPPPAPRPPAPRAPAPSRPNVALPPRPAIGAPPRPGAARGPLPAGAPAAPRPSRPDVPPLPRASTPDAHPTSPDLDDRSPAEDDPPSGQTSVMGQLPQIPDDDEERDNEDGATIVAATAPDAPPLDLDEPIRAPARSPLASTGFASSPAFDRDGETVARVGDGVTEPEEEEATRAVPRDELFRHQDAHVIVGQDVIGDEATLAIAPGDRTDGAPAIAAALAQTLHSDGAPAFPPPPSGFGPAAGPPSAGAAPVPPSQRFGPGPMSSGPMSPGPMPSWPGEPAGPPMGGPGPQGYGSSPGVPTFDPASARVPVPQPPAAGPAFGPQPGGFAPPPAQGPAGPPFGMGWAPDASARPPARVTPQAILLVVVGVVCLAIFVVGIVLFVTTQF